MFFIQFICLVVGFSPLAFFVLILFFHFGVKVKRWISSATGRTRKVTWRKFIDRVACSKYIYRVKSIWISRWVFSPSPSASSTFWWFTLETWLRCLLVATRPTYLPNKFMFRAVPCRWNECKRKENYICSAKCYLRGSFLSMELCVCACACAGQTKHSYANTMCRRGMREGARQTRKQLKPNLRR